MAKAFWLAQAVEAKTSALEDYSKFDNEAILARIILEQEAITRARDTLRANATVSESAECSQCITAEGVGHKYEAKLVTGRSALDQLAWPVGFNAKGTPA